MVQCSKGTPSHQPSKADLTNRQAHDLAVELTRSAFTSADLPAARHHPRQRENDRHPLAPYGRFGSERSAQDRSVAALICPVLVVLSLSTAAARSALEPVVCGSPRGSARRRSATLPPCSIVSDAFRSRGCHAPASHDELRKEAT